MSGVGYVGSVDSMICILDSVPSKDASYIFELLTVNQVECLVENYSGSLPDLESSGMRQIMVHQKDQEKAQRLLSELEPPAQTPEEYHEVGLGSKRRHLLSMLAAKFSHH